MVLFGKRKMKEGELVAVFDIGSGTVGGALSYLKEDSAPEVCYTNRTPISFNEDIEFSEFIDSMVRSLEKVATDLETKGVCHKSVTEKPNRRIDRVLCVFSSPWYMSESKTISFHKKNPIVISKRYMRELLDSESSKLLKSREVVNSEKTEDEPEVLEHKIVDISLNGYSVNVPYGKKVTDISFALYTSIVSSNTKKKVERVLEKKFHTKNIEYHTSALAIFDTVRDVMNFSGDYLFVDINAEITDLFIIENGKISDSVSFPLGTHHLVRTLMARFKTTFEHAYSTLSLSLKDEGSKDIKAKVDTAVERTADEWSSLAHDALLRIKRENTLPNQIFALSDQRFSNLLEIFIEDYTNQFKPKGSFMIDVLNLSDFKDYVKYGKKVRGDLFTAVYTLYADKISHDY